MIIRTILKFLLISFLFHSSLSSFSQNRPIIQIFDSTKVCEGYILYMGVSKCPLIDRKGNTLINIPGNLASFFNDKKKIASAAGGLAVYNKNFDLIWKVNTYIHHELTVTHDDNVLLLSCEYDTINHTRVQFDIVLCFDSTGKELYKWSTYDQRRYLMSYMMKDTNIFRYNIRGSSDPDSVLFNMAPRLLKADANSSTREFFHSNAIYVIPENESEKKDSVFRKGNIILSFSNNNDVLASFIAIVDPVSYKILWHYVQKDRRPMHTPTMLPNGHILIYVNASGSGTDSSVIDEIDPITKEVVWNYVEKFPQIYMRGGRGSCQRLPNGNTLIANTNGYIVEITPEKKIVWQCLINETKGSNPFLYRAFLYPKEQLKWLINEE